jgi:uncharacterized protein Smg (DUF494 family)
MFYEKIIEIIVYLLTEMKSNKQLNEIDMQHLSKLGYTQNEISTAFSWIYTKLYPGEKIFSDESRIPHSYRMLHDVEKNIITPEAHGYLIQLRELSLINDVDIESIIDRVIVSGFSKVTLEDMKSFVAGYLLDSDEGVNSKGWITPKPNDTIN